jgi:hypothetical protein
VPTLVSYHVTAQIFIAHDLLGVVHTTARVIVPGCR